MIAKDLMRKYKYGYVHSCKLLEEPFVKDLLKENQELKNNWNKLKEKTNEGIRICRNRGYDLVFDIEEIPKEELDDFLSYLAFQVMERLIINIEQESDNNE